MNSKARVEKSFNQGKPDMGIFMTESAWEITR